ncbi:MAG: polysaccharide deacetylase family protein [Candidatus Cryosericum sp.]
MSRYRTAHLTWAKRVILLSLAVLCLPLATARADESGQPSFYTSRVVVVTFHDVNPQPCSDWSVTPEQFEKTLTGLRTVGFQFISAEQFDCFMRSGVDIPPDAVLVTIDDGSEDVYTYAWPILRRLGVPALVNVIGSRVDVTPSALTTYQLRDMEQTGLVAVGGHSWNLHHSESARSLSVAAALAVHPLETPFFRSLCLLQDAENVQRAVTSITSFATPFYACPFGAYDGVYLTSLQRAGFSYVFDSFAGSVTRASQWLRLPRVDIGLRDYTFHQVVQAVMTAAISRHTPPVQAGSLLAVGGDEDLPRISTASQPGPAVAVLPGVSPGAP